MENISDSQATGQKNTIHSCGMWDLSSLTRDRTGSSAVKAQSPNHQMAREVPMTVFFISTLSALSVSRSGLPHSFSLSGEISL